MPVQTKLYKVSYEAYNQQMPFRILFLTCLFFYFTMPASAAIYINEIYPKTQQSQSQFIELYNAGEQAISLDRWRIEQRNGDKKSFQFNASYVLQAKQFLLLHGGQTGIVFPIEGDTVTLINEKNEIVDRQGYEGILGFNTSMGRTKDGVGIWAICSSATPEKPNSCPEPTPTSTPLPTNKPTPTIYIDDTLYVSTPSVTIPFATPLPTQEPINIQATPTAALQKNNTQAWFIPIGILVLLWGLIGGMILVRQSTKVKA